MGAVTRGLGDGRRYPAGSKLLAKIDVFTANSWRNQVPRLANTNLENTNLRITAVNLTRAGLITSAVLGIVLTAFVMLPSFGEYVTHAAMNYQRGIVAPLIASALAPIITLGICWYLITGSDAIAQRMFPDEIPNATQTERAIYRVVFTSIGILILVSTTPSFIHAIGNTFLKNADGNLWPDDFYKQFTFYNLPYIVAFVVQFTLAIYLIVGAPRLIRWQTSRTSDAGYQSDQPKSRSRADSEWKINSRDSVIADVIPQAHSVND